MMGLIRQWLKRIDVDAVAFSLVLLSFLAGNFEVGVASGFYGRLLTWVGLGLAASLAFSRNNRAPWAQLWIRKELSFIYLILFFLWASILVISLLWSRSPGFFGHQVEGFILVFLGVIIALTAWGKMTQRARDGTLLFFGAAILLMVPISILEGFDGANRITFFDTGPNTYARALAFSVIILTLLTPTKKDSKWLAATIFGVVGILFSGSRGVALALVVALAAALVFYGTKVPSPRGAIKVSAQLLISWFGIIWCVLVLPGRFFRQESASDLNITEAASDLNITEAVWENRPLSYSSGRDELFRTAWDLFLASPVYGVGLNSFREASISNSLPEGTYVHNIVLATLAEGGAFSAIPLAGCLAVLVLASRRSWGSSQSLVLFSLTVFSFVHSLFSGDYYDARFFWLFSTLLVFSSDQKNTANWMRLPRPGPPRTG